MFGSPELKKYREAIKELLWIHPAVGSVARSMGEPIFTHDEPTAFLELDDNKEIRFNFNPEFILDTDIEIVSAVIAHESYHLVLDHFQELVDKVIFPNTKTLVIAQEIIVNDTIENIYHMTLPDFVYRGLQTLGEDCSQYTSKQVYDKLLEDQDENQDQNGGQGKDEHGCGGLHNSDGISDEDAKTAKGIQDAFNDLIDDIAKSEGKTPDEVKNDLLNDHGGGFSIGNLQGDRDGALSRERLNWKHLLAQINPKIMDSGSPKRRTESNWMKPNRRMVAIYPKVIVPVSQPKEKSSDNDNGDMIPSFVIALDLSGSIPLTLVDTLQGFLEDIPSDLINAFPCTWSSHLVPFDPETRKICRRDGTSISRVSRYVNEVKSETGRDPYVLVITDGQIYGDFTRPGKQWYWMAINANSVSQCQKHADKPEYVYNIEDFTN
jgi:predicted metal-dependent peptidase